MAFTDGDCMPAPGWLTSLKSCFARGVAGVEGRTVSAGKIFPDSHFIKNPVGGMYVTCNIAFLKKYARFDENYRYPNREDSDLAFRVISGGNRVVFSGKSLVKHRMLTSSLGAMLRRKLYFESDVLLFSKYPELYRRMIKFPIEKFTPLYVVFALAGLFSPFWLLALPAVAAIEIAFRGYSFSPASFVKFLVAQSLGGFLNIFAVLRGCVRYRVNPFRMFL